MEETWKGPRCDVGMGERRAQAVADSAEIVHGGARNRERGGGTGWAGGVGRGGHRRKAWLTLFSSSRPGGSDSPPLPVMSARWNQRSRALPYRMVFSSYSSCVVRSLEDKEGVGEWRAACADFCAPAESFWVEHVDAGYAVWLDTWIIGNLNRPLNLKRV
jgi:hypothetical protein